MFTNKEIFKKEFERRIIEKYGRGVHDSHITEKYDVLGTMVRDYASINWKKTKDAIKNDNQKQVIYFSLEFLIGRLLVNNMQNLGIYEVAKEGLKDLDINIHELEEKESDAGLGNGGLGRLAACFMDSSASLGLPVHGNSIRYEYGFFKQKIENGFQLEVPDQWLTLGNVWEIRKPKHAVEVKFYGHVETYNVGNRTMFRIANAECVRAVPYDVPVVGHANDITNTLRLWSSEPSSENLPKNKDFATYLNGVKQLCHGLYPDDSTEQGKILRLKQQYFFVSAGLQSYVKMHLRTNKSLSNFHEKFCIQLNDTHPVLCIPELMRILMDEYSFEWDDAWNIVSNTMAYTNHTVMAEALEKWPCHYVQQLLPRLYMIIEEINRRFQIEARKANMGDEKIKAMLAIKDGMVYMANLACIASYSINGVAYLHTEILKKEVLKEFYELYPNKFNNKTNGITHRRWLVYSNPQLTNLINETIGNEWIMSPDKLEKLYGYVDDAKLQKAFLNVKKQRKEIMADYILKHNGVEVDTNSIFDIQVKRLHAYKRQMLNVLHIIYLYQRIKNDPTYKPVPRTFIFGAKAAPSYYFAKKVIELICSLEKTINNDPVASKYLKVVFIENYDVSKAEIIMPSADVSEQISTAGKEASGTGNMKFMINGAITLGTLDGANVEISELVGNDNCVIFGLRETEITELKNTGSYNPWNYYNDDPRIKNAMDSLVDSSFVNGHSDNFRPIFDEIMFRNDEYFLLADFASYVEAQEKIGLLYSNKKKWAHICLANIAKAGFFSSDRTINQYCDDIWKLNKINLK